MEAKLIKIDRNGTKYYEGLVPCPRCGGDGLYGTSPYLPDHGICWQCGGAKRVRGTWKEYTPEYQAKLDKRRLDKQALKDAQKRAEATQRSKEWLQRHGFDENGRTYIFLGDTYNSRDQLKAAGASYEGAIGWHAASPIEGWEHIEAHVSEVASCNVYGEYTWEANKSDWDARKRKLTCKSQFVGTVGSKLTIEVTYETSFSYEAHFSYYGSTQFIHKFKDDSGNIIVWKTSNILEHDPKGDYKPIAEGAKLVITGTVKEHSEYQGEAQTVLTRCKYKEVTNGI